MELTLHYQGPLKSGQSSGISQHKHKLRQLFHQQLKTLWENEPLKGLSENKELLLPASPENPLSIIMLRNGYSFAPLISEKHHLTAKLDITILRPGPSGAILAGGGRY